MVPKDRYEEVQVVPKWNFQSELDVLSLIASLIHTQRGDDHFKI